MTEKQKEFQKRVEEIDEKVKQLEEDIKEDLVDKTIKAVLNTIIIYYGKGNSKWLTDTDYTIDSIEGLEKEIKKILGWKNGKNDRM